VIIATEYKTDARVDGTIRDSHKEGDRFIEPKATRAKNNSKTIILKEY